MAQAHVCGGNCTVVHLFGNCYQCQNSGAVHVCDANCDQRLWNGRHCSICRVSKRLFPPLPAPGEDMATEHAVRKRASSADDEEQQSRKRVYAVCG